MAIRSIASLAVTFGLVSIPVKVYLATESSAAVKFKLMAPSGARVRQQYVEDAAPVELGGLLSAHRDDVVRDVAAPTSGRGAVVSSLPAGRLRALSSQPDVDAADEPPVVERTQMLKGYEFEKGQFVLFTPDELKALEAESRHTIDIVAFIPERSVDPVYFDKAYFLAPDRHGGKPYSLLRRAMQQAHRCALAKWAWRSKEYVVEIRPAEGGMVLQQLLYADEVRSIDALGIELAPVGDTELRLATQLIEQISVPSYDPHAFVDEEKQRILAAVERKIAGRQIVSHRAAAEPAASAEVVDLVGALRASLERKPARRAATTGATKAAKVRKG